ncbi:pseudoazurin [Bartonella tamiae]|uniref:Pseudoazurin n=1 Tax=Bartonella tamiae Th239 TaxID=1094558 RepID=J1JX34_9HYPH|nr:pseudoazurin [Bartonella tamiae]EJF89165.1 pseudoazurin [Bartonella tamiae Th239]
MRLYILIFILFGLFSTSAYAETFEVKMLNRGEKGSMVFEPDYLEIKPGDKIHFIATQKSHNAATIDHMIPQGASPFKSKIDEELVVTFDKSGFYGIKCTPHYAMGMVMLVKVGQATFPQTYRDIKFPGLAKKRFQVIFNDANL